MNRDQPPCNSCVKHDCRTCVWTSPLDASYRNFALPRSSLSFMALDARNRDRISGEPSWLAVTGKRLIRLFKDASPLAR